MILRFPLGNLSYEKNSSEIFSRIFVFTLNSVYRISVKSNHFYFMSPKKCPNARLNETIYTIHSQGSFNLKFVTYLAIYLFIKGGGNT